MQELEIELRWLDWVTLYPMTMLPNWMSLSIMVLTFIDLLSKVAPMSLLTWSFEIFFFRCWPFYGKSMMDVMASFMILYGLSNQMNSPCILLNTYRMISFSNLGISRVLVNYRSSMCLYLGLIIPKSPINSFMYILLMSLVPRSSMWQWIYTLTSST